MGVPSLAAQVAAELQGMRPEVAGNALRAGKNGRRGAPQNYSKIR